VGLRDLLVYVDNSSRWRRQLALATDLASRHGCRLTAAYTPHLSERQLAERRTAEIGLVSGSDVGRLDQRAAATMAATADAVREELEAFGRTSGLPVRWCLLEAPASVSLPQEARYADLCILEHSQAAEADPTSYTLAEKLLFTTGRPILSIPPNPPASTLGQHVAVAWNSSRASARSLHDALLVIQAAAQVTVITVNPASFSNRPGAAPIERLLDHLELHGVRPELVAVTGVPGGAIAETLQDKAREVGADMLVAGAFGQPRLWERLMGGTTRDLLDRMTLPVQMSS
jgi:nucleotide-binding universal stress UspA family protein